MYTSTTMPTDDTAAAYRQQLQDRGYRFTAYNGDLETFRAQYRDVGDIVRDQMLAGKLVWDTERGGYWEAPGPLGREITNMLYAVGGALLTGAIYAAYRAINQPTQSCA